MEHRETVEVDFFHEVPGQSILPDLDGIIAISKRIDAVVAYVSNAGVEEFFKIINRLGGRAMLIASLEWPTDLDALGEIVKRYPKSVRIHMGQVQIGNRKAQGRLHSKMLLSHRHDGLVDIVVGSHNWTKAALGSGGNFEASTHITVPYDHELVKKAEKHIQRCKKESVILVSNPKPDSPGVPDPYSPIGLQPLQHPPGSQYSLPEVEVRKVTVLYVEAEDDQWIERQSSLVVYVNLRLHDYLSSEFEFEGDVDLWVYPAGTLHRHSPPLSSPTHFAGTCDMLNRAEFSGPVSSRYGVTAKIVNLSHSVLQEARDVSADAEGVQAIINVGKTEEQNGPFVYCLAAPSVKADILKTDVSYVSMPERSALTVDEVEQVLSIESKDYEAGRIKVFTPKLSGLEIKAHVFGLDRFHPSSVRDKLFRRSSEEKVSPTLRPKITSVPRAGAKMFVYRAGYIIRKSR